MDVRVRVRVRVGLRVRVRASRRLRNGYIATGGIGAPVQVHQGMPDCRGGHEHGTEGHYGYGHQ